MSKLSYFLYEMGKVADGKKTFNDLMNDIRLLDKYERDEIITQAKDLWNRFTAGVRESYKDRSMADKYDMSTAVKGHFDDGNTFYIGARPKPTTTKKVVKGVEGFLGRIGKEVQKIGSDIQDLSDLLSGKMTPAEYDKKHPKITLEGVRQKLEESNKKLRDDNKRQFREIINSNSVTRGVASVFDGLKKLRGLGGNKQPQPVRVNSGRGDRGGFGPNRGGDGR